MQNLPASVARLDSISSDKTPWYVSSMERLTEFVQDLSHARTLESVMAITRNAARDLTGADGATFVLRDGDQCHYAEENAIEPLWKGLRFPLKTCISGWVMLNAEVAVIEDIYSDSRIPHEAYRPTFVKSLAMVPIRRQAPIGAIGNYWAKQYLPSREEVSILQALADAASIALENVALYSELQRKIKALEATNEELSRFAWVASHDLQEPLRTITNQMELLSKRYSGELPEIAHGHIKMAIASTGRLHALVEDLLVHSDIEEKHEIKPVNMAKILNDSVITDMAATIKDIDLKHSAMPWVMGNEILLGRLLQNLVANAARFRSKTEKPTIEITARRNGNFWEFCVADNGIGIDPRYHAKIFDLFHRQHSRDIYPGSGIGLASCKKIADLHGGKIWVESTPNVGSSFFFTLQPAQGTI